MFRGRRVGRQRKDEETGGLRARGRMQEWKGSRCRRQWQDVRMERKQMQEAEAGCMNGEETDAGGRGRM